MPTYEYACTACGERTEAKQSFDDPPLLECPVCGGRLRKLYSPVGIMFKGSGFYSTDARKRPAASGARTSDGSKAERSERADKKESKESKGSTKPATEKSS